MFFIVLFVTLCLAASLKEENNFDLVKDVLENPPADLQDHLNSILFVAGATECPKVLSFCLETCKKAAPCIEKFLVSWNRWDELMEAGRVDLLAVFHEYGYIKKEDVSAGTAVIRDIPTLKFLYANQLNSQNTDLELLALFQQITVQDLRFFLDHGLDVHADFENVNMLELALKEGRLDLARDLHYFGLRLSWPRCESHFYDQYDLSPGRLAMHMARLEVTPKLQLLMAAVGEYELLPVETFACHIGYSMLRIAFMEAFDSLFE